jgi:hypothetical protein
MQFIADSTIATFAIISKKAQYPCGEFSVRRKRRGGFFPLLLLLSSSLLFVLLPSAARPYRATFRHDRPCRAAWPAWTAWAAPAASAADEHQHDAHHRFNRLYRHVLQCLFDVFVISAGILCLLRFCWFYARNRNDCAGFNWFNGFNWAPAGNAVTGCYSAF